MQSRISFREVVATSGNFPILAGFNLEIGSGEIVHVKGRNGAGKTSFLRAVAGLVRITRGEAVVLGVDLRTNASDVRHLVGFLGHETSLYEDLSAKENVEFVLKATRTGTSKVASALEVVGIRGRLWDLRVSKMSAGQRKKVALASLIARSPDLWLLDEPHASLDGWTRDVLDLVLNQAVKSGATVILASHERDHGSLSPTRTIEIAGGKVIGDRIGESVADYLPRNSVKAGDGHVA